MEHDFWCNIFIRCKTNDVLNCRLVCKNSKIKIDEEHFWKVMTLRNFRDIHKLNKETWLSYYKRRSINYGIPVIVGTKDELIYLENINPLYKDSDKFTFDMIENNVIKCLYNSKDLNYNLNKQRQIDTKEELFLANINLPHKDSHKFTFDMIENNALKCLYNSNHLETYILTKQHQVYCLSRFRSQLTNEFENRITFLNYPSDIKNIEISIDGRFFFVDSKNDLYSYNLIIEASLLDTNIINIFRSYGAAVKLYFTKICGTYSILSNGNIIKILDEPVLAYLRLGQYEYFINNKNQLLGGIFNSKEHKYLRIKAKQLSFINSEYFIVLRTDGFIIICNEKEKQKIKINVPNINSITKNSFLTENGDLYYFNQNLTPVLIDHDVVDIGNFGVGRYPHGCYVKRHF